MAKATNPYKHFSITVADGGNLISGSNSQDTAGAANYVEKVNFRRESDGEVRREGWDSITAPDGIALSTVGNSNDPVRLLHQFDSEGKKVLICAAADKLYRLVEETQTWKVIAEGLINIDHLGYNTETQEAVDKYKLEPVRWEVVAIDGYCIFNNGVDLPLYYREDWPCAFPLFSLRERGIIRCGTIAEFDGRLFIADVEYIDESIQYNFSYFMSTAYSPYMIPEIFDEFDDYFYSYRVPHMIEFSAWRLADDQREARAAPYLFGQSYDATIYSMSGTNINSIRLSYPLGGARDQNDFFTSLVHNPYFFPTEEEVAEFRYKHSTFIAGDSIRMSIKDSAGIVKVYDAEVTDIEGDFILGETLITITDAYNNISSGVVTSTGDAQSESDASIAEGDEVQFILLKEPDTFSADDRITREASDTFSFPEDGSSILKMNKLGDKLLVHRETGYLSISRGDQYTAFYYEEKYKGERVADFRNTVINIDEQRQVFMGYNGVYFITLGQTDPMPFTPLTVGPEAWRLISPKDVEHTYASINPLTNELFIVCPINYNAYKNSIDIDYGVLAYDMTFGTVSQIDAAFTAMCSTYPSELFDSRRFLMATHIVKLVDGQYNTTRYIDSESARSDLSPLGSRIVRYGYGSREGSVEPYREFSRDGVDFESKIVFGKNDFADRFSEKKLRSYALHMSDIFDYSSYMVGDYVGDGYGYLDTAVVAKVKLSTYSTTQVTETEEIIEELEDMSSEVMIPTYAQGNYYQDTITLTGLGQPFKFIGRTFEVSGVRTRHTSEVMSDAA